MAVAPMRKIVVVDDHISSLEGTCCALRKRYGDAKLVTTTKASEVESLVQEIGPDVLIMDLSMPGKDGENACTETGLNLLRSLLTHWPTLNIVVQSVHSARLICLKSRIDQHHGGFIIADKSLTNVEMLVKVDWAFNGLLYTPPELRLGLEVKPEWLKLLQLAFVDGLTDKAIAVQLHCSIKTVRNYWTRVQNALGVYPAAGVNIRVQTYNRARHVGLLD